MLCEYVVIYSSMDTALLFMIYAYGTFSENKNIVKDQKKGDT